MLTRRRMMMNPPIVSRGVIGGVIQDSWGEVVRICKAGKAKDFYSVGDHLPLTFDGITINMDYVGRAQRVRADGGDNTNLTTWICREIAYVDVFWNETKYTEGGWAKSTIRKFCQETIYPALPDVVRNAVVNVCTLYNDPYNGTDTSSLLAKDFVWIPAMGDLSGASTSLYKDRFSDNASRIKTYKGTPISWWTSTCVLSTDSNLGDPGKSASYKTSVKTVSAEGKTTTRTYWADGSSKRGSEYPDKFGVVFGICI